MRGLSVRGEAALDEREGGGEIAVRRVCVRERLDRCGLDRCVLVCERLEGLEELDRLADLSLRQRQLREPQQCTAPHRARLVLGAERPKRVPGRCGLTEALRELGIGERELRCRHAVALACREVVGADPEPCPELAQQLQGRNPDSRLDAGDVRGRAALECQVALTQSSLVSEASDALSDGSRIVHVT